MAQWFPLAGRRGWASGIRRSSGCRRRPSRETRTGGAEEFADHLIGGSLLRQTLAFAHKTSRKFGLVSRLLDRVLLDAEELRLVIVGQRGGDQAILAHDKVNQSRRFRAGICEAALKRAVCHEAA